MKWLTNLYDPQSKDAEKYIITGINQTKMQEWRNQKKLAGWKNNWGTKSHKRLYGRATKRNGNGGSICKRKGE